MWLFWLILSHGVRRWWFSVSDQLFSFARYIYWHDEARTFNKLRYSHSDIELFFFSSFTSAFFFFHISLFKLPRELNRAMTLLQLVRWRQLFKFILSSSKYTQTHTAIIYLSISTTQPQSSTIAREAFFKEWKIAN